MAAASAQFVMSFAPTVSYAAEDFIEGNANADALQLIRRWPDWPYSMVLLHGEEGCGKTHLAHVFATISMATFIDAARVGSAPADQLLTGNHRWVLDDVECVRDASALAQLINHVRARGDYLLLTARKPAAELSFTLADLQSRLKALPAIALGAPDDALLMAVLAKAFADRQLRIAPDVLPYAITRLERRYEAVQQFAARMDTLSLTTARAVTLPLVRRALSPVKEV